MNTTETEVFSSYTVFSSKGKEVAANMVKLNPGTVVFEDINQEMIKGQVLKPIEKNSRLYQKDPLDGRIRYRGKDRSEVCCSALVVLIPSSVVV